MTGAMLVLLAGISVDSAVSQPGTVVVETTHGRVRGLQELDPINERPVVAFYGVPFAAPPVGDLRFAPPATVKAWPGVLDCTTKKLFQACPQFPVAGGVVSYGSEDCLYMNIYIPTEASRLNSTELPVFFWIYGGGYVIGDKDEFGWYDGKNLATSRNVVVVEPNYRLGALGALTSDALLRESGGTAGNQGPQDQQQALRFAYFNVDRFGGANDKITIAGESAGAMSVCWHYVSIESRKYFQNAIMESGTCSSAVFFVSLPRAKTFGAEVAEKVGCGADDLKCLRALPFQDFFMCDDCWAPLPIPGTNTSILPPLSAFMPYGPTIDKDPRGLMARPMEILSSFAADPKPVILGTNLNEGTLFLPMISKQVANVTLPLSDDGVLLTLLHFFNDSTADEVLTQYQGLGRSNDEKIEIVLRDFFFLCPNVQAAQEIAGSGARAYLYQFVLKIPLWIDYLLLGDYHTIEMSFVFDNQWPPILHNFGPREREMADALGAYWTNLARFNDPNGGDAPLHWPAHNFLSKRHLYLDIPLRDGNNLEKETCDFWRTRREKFYFE